MSLVEAVLARRAEEQLTSAWREPEPPEPRRLRLARPQQRQHKGGTKPTCLCGSCRKCTRREWMRNFRAGQPTSEKRYCDQCGERRYGNDEALWCSTCQQKRPAAHRRAKAFVFAGGGGI